MKRLLCLVAGHKWHGTYREDGSCEKAMTCARCGKQTTITEHVYRQDKDPANPCHTTEVCTRCGAQEDRWAHDFHWSFQDERVCLKQCHRCGLRTEEQHKWDDCCERPSSEGPHLTEVWCTCSKCGGDHMSSKYLTVP